MTTTNDELWETHKIGNLTIRRQRHSPGCVEFIGLNGLPQRSTDAFAVALFQLIGAGGKPGKASPGRRIDATGRHGSNFQERSLPNHRLPSFYAEEPPHDGVFRSPICNVKPIQS